MLSQFAFSRFRSFFAKALCCSIGMGVVVLAASAQEGRIVSFDVPGADLTPGGFNGTYPGGINAWGAITGTYIDGSFVYRGFLRGPGGKFTTFDAPGADTTAGSYNGTLPNSINDLGAITGVYYDANGSGHGFVRSPQGKFATFDPPDSGDYATIPIAINLEGTIVGYYLDPNGSARAFLRSPNGEFKTWIGPGACTVNGSQGCYGSSASNINAFGIVAGGFNVDNGGTFVHHSYVRTPDGKVTTIDFSGAGTGNYQGTGCPGCFLGLNQFGVVAGSYVDSNSVNHGFLRSPDGKITTFDAPGAGTAIYQGTGCFSDCSVSINNWGAITGTYIDANYTYHGYLRSPNEHIVTIDPVGSTGTGPVGINDAGAITGLYLDANNVYHGFVRIPD